MVDIVPHVSIPLIKRVESNFDPLSTKSYQDSAMLESLCKDIGGSAESWLMTDLGCW